MARLRTLHSKSEVDRAGDFLRSYLKVVGTQALDGPELEIVDDWRASHQYPMFQARMKLTSRSKRLDRAAVVVQRLKRLTSIQSKLAREEKMRLSRMNDLGGCRAIVQSPIQVYHLASSYIDESSSEQPVGVWNYVKDPKPDGYRGVHLSTRFNSRTESFSQYNGRLVELQLRTYQQHTWSTAVEVFDTFQFQKIKNGQGSPDWRRFFVLMACYIADLEDLPLVAGVSYGREFLEEIVHLEEKLGAVRVLEACKAGVTSLGVAATQKARDLQYVLTLDSEKKTVEHTTFETSDPDAAEELVFALEKQNAREPHIQSVLVSAESMANLRKAYVNYYLDTTDFLILVRGAVEGGGGRRADSY